MNGAFPAPGDDELHAYLDREIGADRRSAIETFLKGSPLHAERVEGWRRQQQAIRAAFALVETEPAPASILLPPSSGGGACLRLLRPCAEASPADAQRRTREPAFWRKGAVAGRAAWRACARPLAVAAIFAAGAVVALAGAFFADRLHAPPIVADIRAAAPVSADEVLAARTVAALNDFKPPERADASGARPERARPASGQALLVVPNLSGIGFTLVGMRGASARSGAPGEEMFCLFYAKAADPAVALCVARDTDGGRAGRFHVEERAAPNGSEGAISWRQANAIYTLAGPLAETRLRDLANRISAEIDAFD
jgi:hypothetical protein